MPLLLGSKALPANPALSKVGNQITSALPRAPNVLFDLIQSSYGTRCPGPRSYVSFIRKQYANKGALYNHLSKYVSTQRLPADGHHDTLQLKQVIRRLYPSAYKADKDRKYRYWTCCKIITSRRQFTEHVIYQRHQPSANNVHKYWRSDNKNNL